jgi:hemerythrin-like domain-containing protein
MLSEHGRGRELIHEMELASSRFQESPEVSGRRWAQAAMEYSDLLREHIAKENDILFEMADSLLTSEEQERLAQQFEQFEIENMGAGTHERLHSRMNQLLKEIAS